MKRNKDPPACARRDGYNRKRRPRGSLSSRLPVQVWRLWPETQPRRSGEANAGVHTRTFVAALLEPETGNSPDGLQQGEPCSVHHGPVHKRVVLEQKERVPEGHVRRESICMSFSKWRNYRNRVPARGYAEGGSGRAPVKGSVRGPCKGPGVVSAAPVTLSQDGTAGRDGTQSPESPCCF